MNQTNFTGNKKTRNKNKKQTYSAAIKGITNKDTNEKVISFEEIKASLIRADVISYVISPPAFSCDTSVCNNSSDQIQFVKVSLDAFSPQNDGLLLILEDPQNESHVNDNPVSSNESRTREGFF